MGFLTRQPQFITRRKPIMEKISVIKGRVFLFLPDKSYKPKRQLGFIKDRTFITYRKPDNHYFIKFNAVGLNYELINRGGYLFDKIKIEFGFNTLETSRKYFLANSKFLHFKRNGLDKQLFLNLNMFGMDKAEAWEKIQKPFSTNLQTGLFDAKGF